MQLALLHRSLCIHIKNIIPVLSFVIVVFNLASINQTEWSMKPSMPWIYILYIFSLSAPPPTPPAVNVVF